MVYLFQLLIFLNSPHFLSWNSETIRDYISFQTYFLQPFMSHCHGKCIAYMRFHFFGTFPNIKIELYITIHVYLFLATCGWLSLLLDPLNHKKNRKENTNAIAIASGSMQLASVIRITITYVKLATLLSLLTFLLKLAVVVYENPCASLQSLRTRTYFVIFF